MLAALCICMCIKAEGSPWPCTYFSTYVLETMCWEHIGSFKPDNVALAALSMATLWAFRWWVFYGFHTSWMYTVTPKKTTKIKHFQNETLKKYGRRLGGVEVKQLFRSPPLKHLSCSSVLDEAHCFVCFPVTPYSDRLQLYWHATVNDRWEGDE